MLVTIKFSIVDVKGLVVSSHVCVSPSARVIVTVGARVYLNPGFVIEIFLILLPNIISAVAPALGREELFDKDGGGVIVKVG